MNQNASRFSAERKLHLGRAWKLKGDTSSALSAFRDAIEMDPTSVSARVFLADFLLELGETNEAYQQYDRALTLEPKNPKLVFRSRYLKTVVAKRKSQTANDRADLCLPNNPMGKIRIGSQNKFACHRGGWDLAIEALHHFHNSKGVLFDSFLERNFAWKHWRSGVRDPTVLKRLMYEGGFDQLATSEEKGITPYKEPWVGFLHNPHNMPDWFHYQESPQSIFSKTIWQRSLPHCLGLFCLSEYQAEWLRTQVECPVSVLTLPADISETRFNFERFLDNPNKKLVQIGWWLRKLSSIYRLPLARSNPMGYQKVRLVPHFFDDADRYLKEFVKREREQMDFGWDIDSVDNTRDVKHLPNSDYDQLLAENIAFIELYDSGANNTIVECISRATPLLVNPLPSVVEYLGHDYPLYFTTLDEAAKKALDVELLHQGHLYLKGCSIREQLSINSFRKSFAQSEVYRSLPFPKDGA